jgi:hypothetical protein
MSYALSLLPALYDLRDALSAGGVPCSLDRQKLPVPGAWITPETMHETGLDGSGVARVSVFLVAPAAGEAEALSDLQGLLAKALAVVDPDDDVDTSVALTVRANALPAFRIPLDVDLPANETEGP